MPQPYTDPLQRTFDEIKGSRWHTFGLAAIVSASPAENYQDPACRALSNLIGEQWPDQGLPSRQSYWAPTRRVAHQLFAGKRDLSVSGSPSTGGDLAAHGAVLRLAEATRPRTVLQAAGAQMHEVTGINNLTIPAWDEAASGYWVSEGQAIPAAGLEITSGAATPRTAGAQMTISHQLKQQAFDIEGQLTAELSRIVATTVESGFWTGLGGNDHKPLGILNTPGTQTQSFAGSNPTYAELVAMVDKYLDNGGDPSVMTFFCHPKVLTALLTTEVSASTGNFVAGCIHGPRQLSLFGVPVAPTACMTQGPVVLCNPADIHLVFWRAPMIISNPYLGVAGDVRVTVLNDCDVVINRRHSMVIGRTA